MKNAIFVLTLFLSLNSFSQLDFGFIGKKNLLSVYINPSVNFFHNYNDEPLIFDIMDGDIDDLGKAAFRIVPKISYQRLVKPKIAIGLELGYRKSRVVEFKTHSYYSYSYTDIDYYFQVTPVYNTFTFVPTVSFGMNALNGSIGFKGLSFQMGLGVVMYKLDKRNTYFSASFTDNLEEFFLNESDKIYTGLSCFIQLQDRFALGKGMYFDIGVRANSNIMLGSRSSDPSIKGYSTRNARWGLNRVGLLQIFSLKLGLAYQF